MNGSGCADSSGFEPLALGYDEAIAQAERALSFGIRPSLDGITQLLDAMGRPDHTFSAIQIAGTNGKTSVARLTSALLTAHGVVTGTYTSPHLERYNERIEIDGEPISDRGFASALGAALAAARCTRGSGDVGATEGFTEFELLTAAALWAFAEAGVEIAVLEVGLGGRWDATSVVSPSVSVITGIGLDHTAILGETVEKIAAEKAAIIRPASAPVLGPGTQGVEGEFLKRAAECDTHPRAVRAQGEPSPVDEALTTRFVVIERPSTPWGETHLDVRGAHAAYCGLAVAAPAYQAANVATAIAAAEAALGRELELQRVRDALASVRFPGRFELVRRQPAVVVDGSHNPQAAAVLADAIADAWPDAEHRPVVLLGILADKDAAGIVEALAPVAASFAVTRSDSPRALPVSELAGVVESVTGRRPAQFDDVGTALSALVRDGEGDLVVTGSLTTAGLALAALRDTSATG